MIRTFLTVLSCSRIMPKLMVYFIENPNEAFGYRALCRSIEEDPGATWKYARELCKVGFITKDDDKRYRLNDKFTLLPELKVIAETEL